MEGLLILLLVCLPLAWTVLLIVAVCQNSGLADQTKRALESLEKRLDRQQETLLQTLAALRGGSSPAAAPPPDFQAAAETVPPPPVPSTPSEAPAWAATPPPAPSTPSAPAWASAPPQAIHTPAAPAARPAAPPLTAQALAEAARAAVPPPSVEPPIVTMPPPPPWPAVEEPAPAPFIPPPPPMPGQFFPSPEYSEPPAELRPAAADPGPEMTDPAARAADLGRSPVEGPGLPAEASAPGVFPAETVPGPVVLPPEPPAAPPAPPEPAWVDRLWQTTRDYLMRDGHFWVVAGVFVLFLGASFFVRHGIAMGWFPPALRLAATFAVGLVLTGVGLVVRLKKPSWALVVQGCGLALMYLTAVASSGRGYDLVGQGPALAVMTVLVVVTAILALWQNSQLVAHVSIVAAFVAPLLVSEDSGNYVGLFSFYTVLNLGILGMCLVRPWRRLYLTGFSLSFGLFGLWVAQSYRPEMFNTSAPFLVIFYLFYVFIGLYTARNISLTETDAGQSPGPFSDDADLDRRPSIRSYPHGSGFRTDLTLTVMAPILFLSTLAAMAHKPYTLALAAGASGLMYVALFFGLRGRYLPPLTGRIVLWQGLIGLNLGLALFLFDLNPEALSRWTILSLTWSVEGALLHYIGRTKPRLESVYFGLGCLGLSALFSFGAFDWHGGRVASQFLIAGLVLGGALLHATWADLAFDREERPLDPGQPPLAIWALLAWGVYPLAEAFRLSRVEEYQYALSWLTTVWSLMAAVLCLLTRQAPVLLTVGPGPKTDPGWTVPVLISARVAAFVVVLGQFTALLGNYPILTDTHRLQLAGPFEAVAWTFFFVSQALALQQVRLNRTARVWTNLWCGSLVLCLGWLLCSLGLHLGLPMPLPGLARLTVVLAALALIICPPADWLEDFPRDFLAPVTAFLALLALWSFAVLIADPARPAWMPYLPILNTADLFQAAAVILPLTALYKLAQSEQPELCRPLVYGLGIMLFIWLNLVLGRAVHHYGSAPYHPEALFRSGYFQSLAALVWGVVGIGAMITGHRAARRTQWLLGAVLLVADLAKIFFIDLSKVGTVARIVSFLAVGTLLILVGYFAPLPPAAAVKESARDGEGEASGSDRPGEAQL